jgi:hypothetical protein
MQDGVGRVDNNAGLDHLLLRGPELLQKVGGIMVDDMQGDNGDLHKERIASFSFQKGRHLPNQDF